VIHELGEDSLSGIHPSLSAIRAGHGHSVLAPDSAAINSKSKNASYTLSRVICDRYSERPGFSRTLLKDYMFRQPTLLRKPFKRAALMHTARFHSAGSRAVKAIGRM
jgi:hypothetical protein